MFFHNNFSHFDASFLIFRFFSLQIISRQLKIETTKTEWNIVYKNYYTFQTNEWTKESRTEHDRRSSCMAHILYYYIAKFLPSLLFRTHALRLKKIVELLQLEMYSTEHITSADGFVCLVNHHVEFRLRMYLYSFFSSLTPFRSHAHAHFVRIRRKNRNKYTCFAALFEFFWSEMMYRWCLDANIFSHFFGLIECEPMEDTE